MKVRMGFVSNSSSSSFVIARAQIGDDKWDKLVEFLDTYNDVVANGDNDDDDEWYDEMYPNISDNYIYIDTSDCNTEPFYKKLDELGIGKSDYLTSYN